MCVLHKSPSTKHQVPSPECQYQEPSTRFQTRTPNALILAFSFARAFTPPTLQWIRLKALTCLLGHTAQQLELEQHRMRPLHLQHVSKRKRRQRQRQQVTVLGTKAPLWLFWLLWLHPLPPARTFTRALAAVDLFRTRITWQACVSARHAGEQKRHSSLQDAGNARRRREETCSRLEQCDAAAPSAKTAARSSSCGVTASSVTGRCASCLCMCVAATASSFAASGHCTLTSSPFHTCTASVAARNS